MHPSSLNLLFLIITSNAGGEGKTMICKLILAILRLAGVTNIRTFDADPGNWTLANSVPLTKAVGWYVDEKAAPIIAADCMGAHTIIDPGANAFAGSEQFARLVRALGSEFRNAGYRTIAFGPVSTNKDGALDSMVELTDHYAEFDRIYVKVNRDGSGNYMGDVAKLEHTATIEISHFDPGFLSVLADHKEAWDEAVTHPLEGFQIAGAYIGEIFADVADQLAALAVVPADAGAKIRQHFAPQPRLTWRLTHKVSCSDDVLLELQRRSKIAAYLEANHYTQASLFEAGKRFF